MEYRITFYVAGSDVHHPIADKMLANTFGESTRMDARGSWDGPNGIEYEDSVRFEVLTDSPNAEIKAEMIAEDLRRLYRQTEVLYSVEPVTIHRTRAQQPTPAGLMSDLMGDLT